MKPLKRGNLIRLIKMIRVDQVDILIQKWPNPCPVRIKIST